MLPPLGLPGLGLERLNWLGPPCIQSRMQAMPCWHRSGLRPPRPRENQACQRPAPPPTRRAKNRGGKSRGRRGSTGRVGDEIATSGMSHSGRTIQTANKKPARQPEQFRNSVELSSDQRMSSNAAVRSPTADTCSWQVASSSAFGSRARHRK